MRHNGMLGNVPSAWHSSLFRLQASICRPQAPIPHPVWRVPAHQLKQQGSGAGGTNYQQLRVERGARLAGSLRG